MEHGRGGLNSYWQLEIGLSVDWGWMLKNLSTTFITSIIILAANIVGGILTARLLGPTGKGELTAAMIWPNVLAVIGSLGLVESLVYFTGREGARRVPSIFTSSFVVLFFQTVILVGLGLWLIPVVMAQYEASVVQVSLLFLAFIPLNLSTLYLSSIMRGTMSLTAYNAVRFLIPIFYVTEIIVLALAQEVTVLSCALALLVANFLGLIASLIWIHRAGLLHLSPDFSLLRPLIGYGIKAHIGNLSSMLNLRFDQMLMAVVLAPNLLGQYVVAVTMSTGVSLVSTTIATIALPSISQRGIEHNVQTAMLGRLLRFNLWISLLAAVGLVLFASFFISVLFGSDYLEAVSATQVLAFAAMVAGMNGVLAAGLKGLGKPLISTYGEIAGLIATATFLFLLLPRWQILGAAVASLIAYSVTFVIMYLYTWRKLHLVPSAAFLPRLEDWQTVMVSWQRVRHPQKA
jgi:O-antigen/teichoic acid export membrane protein